MPQLKKYDLTGKETGEVEISDEIVKSEANSQMIKDYILAIMENRRQWSASTRGRSEISHSNKKPRPQKGTGGARQGTFSAPQFKGGGVVFGPRPKFDQHQKVNKKEKRAAIRHLLSEMIKKDQICVLDCAALKEPRTKTLASFLKNMGIEQKRVLFLAEESTQDTKGAYAPFMKSMRNLQKKQFKHALSLNGHDVALNHQIVVMEPAVGDLKKLLGVS